MSSPQLNKLDSHLQELVRDRRAGRSLRKAGVQVSPGGRVLVDIYVKRDVRAMAKKLRALGMSVAATSDRGAFRIVEGRLPVGSARLAADLARVRAIVTVRPPLLSVGARTSQGDAAHRGPQARALGPTGVGVDVGIISDSINQIGGGVAASKASGDLPSTVTVLSDVADGTDEGRAMAEIAYDVAPGIARILFASAFTGGPVEKAQAIDNLVAAGADVIADDTAFLNEPFFQDGVVGRAVDRARAAGTVYFTAAGNQAGQSWEGTYIASGVTAPDGGEFNDFDPGAGNDTIQNVVNVQNGDTLSVFLQWDEPFGAAETDVDVYLTTTGGTMIGSPGTANNITSGIPFDGATFTNSTGAAVMVAVRIERFAGPRAPFMKYIAIGDFGGFTVAEHPTPNADAIVPDAATSNGSITVAAVRANEVGLNDPEAFSSRGPKTILFDQAGNRLAAPEIRQKPELAAADGVSTTVPDFSAFFGTSAAAPHAAGVAALLRSRGPSLSPDAVEALMTDAQATTDCNPVGEPDFLCGFGFVFADAALNLFADPTPPVITPVLSPAAPQGGNGFYTSDVGVSWSVSDPGSVVSATSGCDPATVSTDTTGATFACSATSAGGEATQSVTVKRDASPPTVPVFGGIEAQTYELAFLPAASSVACAASDPTSGLAGACQVSGHSRALGAHTLVGTATNGAGLTATATLPYTVVATKPAISRSSAPRSIKLKTFLRSGLLAKVSVARARTKLTAELKGPGGRVALKRLTAGSGRKQLRLRPTRSAKKRLRARRRSVLKLAVTAKPLAGARLTLRRNVVVRR